MQQYQTYFGALHAEAYKTAGKTKEGLSAVDETLERAHKTGISYYEAELQRIKGELLLRRADPSQEQAEACFQKAIDLSRRQGARSLELRAIVSLSRLWQKRGKKEEARQILEEIYGWFTEGLDTADLKEAKALLDQFS